MKKTERNFSGVGPDHCNATAVNPEMICSVRARWFGYQSCVNKNTKNTNKHRDIRPSTARAIALLLELDTRFVLCGLTEKKKKVAHVCALLFHTKVCN